MGIRIKWIETINEFPIFQDISNTELYSNNYEITLPLALIEIFTWNKHFIIENKIDIEFVPRRFYKISKKALALQELINDADIIFLSFTTSEVYDALEILKISKKLSKITVVGGIYPTLCPNEIQTWNLVDFIVCGEGENSFKEVMQYITNNKFIFLQNHNSLNLIIKSTVVDLKNFPILDYETFFYDGLMKYMRSARYMISRGCPHKCTFCSTRKIFGTTNRRREINTIINDFEQIYNLGFKKISIADDSIAIDNKWTKEFFRRIVKSNKGYLLKVRVRADELDTELLKIMKDANVKIIQFGVENISQKILNNFSKGLKRKDIENAFELILNTEGILANPLYMYNSIGETWEDFYINNKFIREKGRDNKVITYISFTTPYPGTELYDIINNKGVLLTHDLRFYNNKFPIFIPNEMIINSQIDLTINKIIDEYSKTSKIVNKYHPTQSPINDIFIKHLKSTNYGNRS